MNATTPFHLHHFAILLNPKFCTRKQITVHLSHTALSVTFKNPKPSLQRIIKYIISSKETFINRLICHAWLCKMQLAATRGNSSNAKTLLDPSSSVDQFFGEKKSCVRIFAIVLHGLFPLCQHQCYFDAQKSRNKLNTHEVVHHLSRIATRYFPKHD